MHSRCFFLKLLGEPSINSFFVTKQMLKGFRRDKWTKDGQDPVSQMLLLEMCIVCFKCCFSEFKVVLFNFAFLLCFLAR